MYCTYYSLIVNDRVFDTKSYVMMSQKALIYMHLLSTCIFSKLSPLYHLNYNLKVNLLFSNKSKGQRVMAPGVGGECCVPSAFASRETRPGYVDSVRPCQTLRLSLILSVVNKHSKYHKTFLKSALNTSIIGRHQFLAFGHPLCLAKN